jgi:tetratricopeptide (TPR) repeat protein
MRYSAFISYNHRDVRWARWLHRSLERYRIPKRLQGRETPFGPAGDRLPPVFRDRDELAASSDLAESVKQALAASHSLIIICSPHAVASRWVNEEIRTFAALGKADRIRLLIVDGEPHSGDPATECLPPAMFEISSAEPLAADLRKGQDGKPGATLKLIASILGLPYDELRQREAARRQRRLAAIASAASVGFLVMAGLTVFALLSRAEAIEQRDLARQRTLTAERTVRFVQTMFEVSDPSQARGETITAREVLERGAKLIQAGLDEEPAVKAELGVTLGEVFGSLGLYKDSDQLVRSTMALPHNQPMIRARQLLALGASDFRMGNYESAASLLERSAKIAEANGADGGLLLPRALTLLGETRTALGDIEGAERLLRRALALNQRQAGPFDPTTAYTLEALGNVHLDAGEFDRARAAVLQALKIRLRAEGKNSPSVSDNYNTLASIAYAEGDNAGAERFFRSRLAVDEKVLGPDHPDVAGTRNSIARMMIERRSYAEAVPLLQSALASNLRQGRSTHDDMAFVYSNLGLAKRGIGRLEEAEGLLAKSVAVARAHDHRTLAPNLTDLAELKCRRGASSEALGLLREAMPLMASTYPDDPWRAAWTQGVMGECMLRNGRKAEGAKLIRASSAVLNARWKPGTHYRAESERRMQML